VGIAPKIKTKPRRAPVGGGSARPGLSTEKEGREWTGDVAGIKGGRGSTQSTSASLKYQKRKLTSSGKNSEWALKSGKRGSLLRKTSRRMEVHLGKSSFLRGFGAGVGGKKILRTVGRGSQERESASFKIASRYGFA